MTSPLITGPRVLGGRYSVERPLGSGATATVYLCRDRTTMQAVAVKVLHTDLVESVGAERFLREIRLTSGLDHPSILPIIDSGAEGSTLYCVLPYMEGGTLRDLLREKKQLSIPEVIEIATTIANALTYAHERGLIHRDIKPENILFHQGKAYLGDFGIARVLHATAGDLTTTTTGVIRGTPAYMSPEQASGERTYDGRSDIYSLGCVVYEMISGMPPFVGPTSQSVVAQRFSTTPREMRAYRGSVSPELERVVAKAMMMVPADRYATAADFARDLSLAVIAAPRVRRGGRAVFIGVIVIAAVVASVAYVKRSSSAAFGKATLPDTTQLVILPFDKQGNVQRLGSIDALINNAFSSWTGLSVLEPYRITDAIARAQSSGRPLEPSSVSSGLGAGRYVRGSVGVLPDGRGWVVQAWLHQVGTDTALKKATLTIRPQQLDSTPILYAGLARTLLLRTTGADSLTGDVGSTRSLPAFQSFAAGMEAMADWNLAEADSQFQRAVTRDPGYGRAYLWQAQVRAWQRADAPVWLPLAEKAVADSTRLPAHDRQLALALRSLGRGDFEASCRQYDGLRRLNVFDFAAWFGLGQCLDSDYRVVRDARSPTGWRYVASYQQALKAYQRAFSVLALSHRSMERGAFEPLRTLLYMRTSQIRYAKPQGDTTQLWGRIDKAGDSLLIRPVTAAALRAGDPSAVPSGMRQAIDMQRQLFGSIAASWSTSLPRSPGAKEAVAVALEMRGDRAALDTMRAAFQRAVDPMMKLRLAAAEIILRLKFLDPADVDGAKAVRRSADSLLDAHREPNANEAGVLSGLAMLVGRCESSASMAAVAPFTTQAGVPTDALGAADAAATRLAGRCGVFTNADFERISRRIQSAVGRDPVALASAFTRIVQFTERPTPQMVASVSGGYLVQAQEAVRRKQPELARVTLSRVEESRQRIGYADVTPDAIYLEAKVWLAIGDTAQARRILDRSLSALPSLTPGLLNRPLPVAGLVRSMQLRASLDRGNPWIKVAHVFWSQSAF